MDNKKPSKCLFCKQPFEKKRDWHKFCSSKCRYLYWKETHPYLNSEEIAEIKKRLNIR